MIKLPKELLKKNVTLNGRVNKDGTYTFRFMIEDEPDNPDRIGDLQSAKHAQLKKLKIYVMDKPEATVSIVNPGWICTHKQSFDFISCHIFEKPEIEITQDEWGWVKPLLKRPKGWIAPTKLESVKLVNYTVKV